jgi:hypothetical protein
MRQRSAQVLESGRLQGGDSMEQFDPAILRRLAARYRQRAKTEPGKAELFEGIPADMEAYARIVARTSPAIG